MPFLESVSAILRISNTASEALKLADATAVVEEQLLIESKSFKDQPAWPKFVPNYHAFGII